MAYLIFLLNADTYYSSCFIFYKTSWSHVLWFVAVTPAEVSPKAKIVLAPTTTSSNRRSSGRNLGVHELSACELLTVDLVRHEDSWPFKKLVSRTQVVHLEVHTFTPL